MAIRKNIWTYPDTTPTLTTHISNFATSLTIAPTLDYLTITAAMTGSANSYLYRDMSSITDYVIQSGDFLEYDIQWSGANVSIGMDFTLSDGNSYRDGGTVDQNGVGMHPATSLNSYANGQWYRRKAPFTNFSGGSAIGKTVQFYDLVCESDSTGTYTALIKNIAITDGNGTGVDSTSSNTFSLFFK